MVFTILECGENSLPKNKSYGLEIKLLNGDKVFLSRPTEFSAAPNVKEWQCSGRMMHGLSRLVFEADLDTDFFEADVTINIFTFDRVKRLLFTYTGMLQEVIESSEKLPIDIVQIKK